MEEVFRSTTCTIDNLLLKVSDGSWFPLHVALRTNCVHKLPNCLAARSLALALSFFHSLSLTLTHVHRLVCG